MNIFHIVGARPNFMMVAPVLSALKGRKSVEQTLIHTGQHYDANLSDVFFQQLGIPAPDVNLAVGSGTHAKQTAEIMIRLEPIVLERQPDMVACVRRCELDRRDRAGVCQVGRSKSATLKRDCARSIEPCRRKLTVLTDQLADLLFTPSEDGDENLRREEFRRRRFSSSAT